MKIFENFCINKISKKEKIGVNKNFLFFEFYRTFLTVIMSNKK